MPSITLFNKSLQKTYEWLKDIEDYLEFAYEDKAKALAILRAVLQTLRDHLSVDSLAHLSAQLPVVIRGLLFEGWDPNPNLLKARKEQDFLDSIAAKLPEIHRGVDLEDAACAVFATIGNRIDPLEFAKLTKTLPRDVRKLMDNYIQ